MSVHHAPPMADPLNLNDLRSLAAALPPSERIQAGESADILSAFAAVLVHGRDILAASRDGGNAGVNEYLHGKAVDAAEQAGTPAPERGQVAADSPAVAPAGAPSGQIDYNKLAEAIVRAQDSRSTSPDAPAVTPAPDRAGVTPPAQGADAASTPTTAEQSAQESQADVHAGDDDSGAGIL